MFFLVETSIKINVDIYNLLISKCVPFLGCLLLTSEHDTNDFHAGNSK